MKAFRYYLMCGIFGDVPYYDEAAKWGDEIDKPRTDKFVIYSKVLQQLVDIEPNMKFSDINTGGIERMNRDFAIGLIARLALFRAGYGKTVDNQMKRADDYLDITADSLTVTYKDKDGVEKTAQSYTQYYQMAKDYFDRFRNGLEPEYLPVHWTDKTFAGKDFKIAEKQLRECGFTNIITVAQDQRKLFDRDYGVVSIKIKEDADTKNGWIAPDTPILLKYTAPAQKQTH